ncbi:MAG: TraR/DksA C4-type zinc finger protein [bacterium]|nr:TraR/DksA C4-type zinc finger protein [bacterium]
MVDKNTTEALKQKLEQELATLELELTDIGRMNPANPSDWEGTAGALKTGTADQGVLADRFEEVTTNEGIVNELEVRYANVKKALDRIKDGTYGTCEECGEEIPIARLEANPAASTCVSHAE